MNRIPEFMRIAMLATCQTIMNSREPDVIIGNVADPYVLRWWIGPHGKEPSAYLHVFKRSDYDGALHDHRYKNVSVILEGQCLEHFHEIPLRPDRNTWATISKHRVQGDVVEREAGTPHRIELISGQPMTTIFFTGAHERDWGFHTLDGWIHWKPFTEANEASRPGGNYGKTGI